MQFIQWLYLNLLSLHFNPSKAVHVTGKFHGPGGHNKRNCLQDRANFRNSRARPIVLIFNAA